MAGSGSLSWYCLACGVENPLDALFCQACGRQLALRPEQQRLGAAFFLNELEALRELGVVGEPLYQRLRQRYRDLLGVAEPAVAGAPAPARPSAPPARWPPARREGPGWLVEQQANLLLYLGAFLIVIAALIYVNASGAASGGARMALLAGFTLLFLVAGLVCMRLSRVRQAGVVFFAVGALMVPLNFVGGYVFFYADEEIDPSGLWLAGSISSALFYGGVSLLGLGRWYPVPAVVAVGSALAAVLVLSDAPPEAYAGSFIALALFAATPAMLPWPRVREAFGPTGVLLAHAVVPPAVLAALLLAPFDDPDVYEPVVELTTRWYLPPTGAVAALFYATQALWARRAFPAVEPLLTVVALAVAGGAAVTLVYALRVGHEWYGPAVAVVGWLYAAGMFAFRARGKAPRWFWQRHLGWLALGAITVSWLFFEGIYADFPRHGAGVHFAAMVFYVGAAWVVPGEIDLLPFAQVGVDGKRQVPRPADGEAGLLVPAAVCLLYAAGLTLGVGFYHLLSSLPAAETAEASDAAWPYFGLSLAIAAVAATMRWWWRDVRLHAYVVAAGMSLFVVLSSVQLEGAVALLLVIYAAVAFAVAVWEREPLALAVPAGYGFFALLAAWRYYEPDDAYLPLVFSAVAYVLFAGYAFIRRRAEPRPGQVTVDLATVLQVLAFAYAAAAPVAGWVRLSYLADDRGFVGDESFEETLLFQTAAASVLLLGLLVAAQSWLVRRIEVAVGASALLMVALLLEIGHLRPENVQAYTAPLGGYLLVAALLASRVRDLPGDLRALIGPLEAVGAALIMGPSFVQSFDEGGWGYGLLLLGEGLCFVALALVQRRLWLLGVSVGFVVLDGVHYLFFAGGPALPNWAILALAGTAVMAAGTAILLGRDRWTEWQRAVQAWWEREPLPSGAK